MIPFLSLIEKENLKIVGAIGQLKKMKEFTFMGLCWEESLESLHARSEYLESVLERSSPDEFMIAIRSQTEEQVIALLLKLKREYGKDDQITELLNYLNSLK
jgi:hypothetical protein